MQDKRALVGDQTISDALHDEPSNEARCSSLTCAAFKALDGVESLRKPDVLPTAMIFLTSGSRCGPATLH